MESGEIVNILCIGDVVGKPGRQMLAKHLQDLIKDRDIDLVICNAENIAGGSGLTPLIFNKLLHYGVDVVTLGDHAFRRGEIAEVLDDSHKVVRPANLPKAAPGRGWVVAETKSGRHRVGVICLLGQLYMGAANSPWEAVDQVLAQMPSGVKIRVIDFHAEASSEKIAMGWHLNGRASLMFGTHTHIPTADARVLDGGTACISDVGMTGPYDSVLGRRKDRVLYFLTTCRPAKFDVAIGDPRICGVLAGIDPQTGRAVSIERIEVHDHPAPCDSGDSTDPAVTVKSRS